MGSSKQNIGIKLEKIFLTGEMGVFDNGNVNWCMLGGGGGGGGGGVSNRAFLCRTMHFAVEPGFFVSNECFNI